MSLVKSITIESEYLPPVVIDDPFAPGQPNFWLQILKPKIIVDVGGEPIVSAPWGEPAQHWLQVKMLLIFIIGFLIFSIVFLRK